MEFGKISLEIIQRLKEIVGEEHVFQQGEIFDSYSHDYTENLKFPPGIVVLPANANEISAVLSLCNENKIPVTPAGARTGLAGGMLPVFGGVSLGLQRMNRILEIDEKNFQVTVEPGVITQVLMDKVAEKGLFYPVDPASRGSCFIGGNLATSSGGMRAVKYGLTKDFVLALEVVLADGRIIHTGAKTLKNSTGYNLTQLFVGSEGTLGVITKATFKLIALPTSRVLMLVPFASAESACRAVSEIFYQNLHPSAVEFVEKDAIEYAQNFAGEHPIHTEGAEAFLLIECDGSDEEHVRIEAEKIFSVLEKSGGGEVLFMDTPEEMNRIWRIRRGIGEATRAMHTIREEDTCVPRAELAKLWKQVKSITKSLGLEAYCFGHAGDGNLHVHIIKPEGEDAEEKLQQAAKAIFEFTVSIGGTLSGEHGIGWVQKNFMGIKFSENEIGLMKQIKAVFDPKGIMNPGKIFPTSKPE